MDTRLTAHDLPDALLAGTRSFTRGELARLLSARRVRTLIDRSMLCAVLPGRYASTVHAESVLVRSHAACAATRGILTGTAALFALGALDRPPATLRVAAAPGTRMPAAPWLSMFRTDTVAVAGMWMCTPFAGGTRAALDAWTDPANADAEGDLLAALASGTTTPAALAAMLDATARVRDRRGLAALLADFRVGAHSPLERIALREVFTGPEFAGLVRQHAVRTASRRYRLDVYDPFTRTAIELDGARYHSAEDRRQRDIRRDADLAGVGILTVRLSFRDVVADPERCRRIVRAVLQSRGSMSWSGRRVTDVDD
ncbi:hypothetical protein RN607_10660 [Demequina capsici]|uniref:Restriction endonuclease type II-like domain-containing protein n=1 Tax=Demequina capsici TaxID=3075620 RepID=A0AA96F897_9MICO|nr:MULTISPECIES: hypothetical protein [unclassified Demequina]WNM23816.1 hypothetical protein RN606_10660 [Demequina sp. OYTSA14]WNM26655.1 hypothetical protein RN607_10660 [Demequina sp. PMTSA13]